MSSEVLGLETRNKNPLKGVAELVLSCDKMTAYRIPDCKAVFSTDESRVKIGEVESAWALTHKPTCSRVDGSTVFGVEGGDK